MQDSYLWSPGESQKRAGKGWQGRRSDKAGSVPSSDVRTSLDVVGSTRAR